MYYYHPTHHLTWGGGESLSTLICSHLMPESAVRGNHETLNAVTLASVELSSGRALEMFGARQLQVHDTPQAQAQTTNA